MLQAAVIPALTGFLLIMAMILLTRRRPVGRPAPWTPMDRARVRAMTRSVAGLALVGYAIFVAIVLLYSVLLQGKHDDSLSTAVWGAPFLMAVAVPAFALFTWIADRAARRRARIGKAPPSIPGRSDRPILPQ
jgi:hypothetical protein